MELEKKSDIYKYVLIEISSFLRFSKLIDRILTHPNDIENQGWKFSGTKYGFLPFSPYNYHISVYHKVCKTMFLSIITLGKTRKAFTVVTIYVFEVRLLYLTRIYRVLGKAMSRLGEPPLIRRCRATTTLRRPAYLH